MEVELRLGLGIEMGLYSVNRERVCVRAESMAKNMTRIGKGKEGRDWRERNGGVFVCWRDFVI